MMRVRLCMSLCSFMLLVMERVTPLVPRRPFLWNPLRQYHPQQEMNPFVGSTSRRGTEDLLAIIFPQDSPYGVKDREHHVTILDRSLSQLTGKGVWDRMGLTATTSSPATDCQTNDRFVLISHGTQEDPIYNFGNLACLKAFARSWEELCQLPSRQSVVLSSQDETQRKQLMAKVTTDGYVEGVSGLRVRGDGTFIQLVDAIVWNCYDENGDYYGQACLFDRELAVVMETHEGI